MPMDLLTRAVVSLRRDAPDHLVGVVAVRHLRVLLRLEVVPPHRHRRTLPIRLLGLEEPPLKSLRR